MREALLILFVIFVLVGLTAFRYRRGIYSAYLFWRQLKELRGNMTTSELPKTDKREAVSAGNMVSCAKCGKWEQESSAITIGGKIFYCSKQCFATASTVN